MSKEETMVERCAQAILERVPQEYGMTEAEARNYALAVIDELMDPTLEMVRAGIKAHRDDFPDERVLLADTFRAMLSKAKEQSNG